MRTFFKKMMMKESVTGCEFVKTLFNEYPEIKNQIRAHDFAVPQSFFDQVCNYTKYPRFIWAYTRSMEFPIPLNYQSYLAHEKHCLEYDRLSTRIELPDKIVVKKPDLLEDEHRLSDMFFQRKITFDEYILLTENFLKNNYTKE